MALNLIAVTTAVMCGMRGPRLALLGPDGSMQKAVKGMNEELSWALRTNLIGTFIFFAAASEFGFFKFAPQGGGEWQMAAIFFGGLVYMIAILARIERRFLLPTDLEMGNTIFARCASVREGVSAIGSVSRRDVQHHPGPVETRTPATYLPPSHSRARPHEARRCLAARAALRGLHQP